MVFVVVHHSQIVRTLNTDQGKLTEKEKKLNSEERKCQFKPPKKVDLE